MNKTLANKYEIRHEIARGLFGVDTLITKDFLKTFFEKPVKLMKTSTC